MATRADRLRAHLAEPVDAASLVALRVAFGVLMMIAVARFFANGWIASEFIEPDRFFTYAGFDWIQPWPGAGMYIHFAVMGVCALFVALGIFYRPALLTFAALFAYAHLVDKTNYLNHYYLIVCLAFVMAWLPLGRGVATVPRAALWAVRLQVGVVYFFGGVAKLQPDWLFHAQPLTAWLAGAGDVPLVGPLLTHPWAPYILSWGAALFDLTIVAWLLWPRSRPYAYAVVIVFHALTARLFHIGMFPWIMTALATVFFAPDWPRRFISWRPRAPQSPRLGRIAGAVLAVHLALQILLPLRSFAYPGPALWNEEGFRFGWNVMVMEKSGVAEFVVRDPDTGREWRLPATAYWTRYQATMMATQPDMVLEAAHVVAADFRRRGIARPEVRADVMVSLNGRPRHRLVDPTVDLAAAHDTLLPYSWVLPPPEESPP
jgi:vitamin K-dependent gamma-carboxylase